MFSIFGCFLSARCVASLSLSALSRAAIPLLFGFRFSAAGGVLGTLFGGLRQIEKPAHLELERHLEPAHRAERAALL